MSISGGVFSIGDGFVDRMGGGEARPGLQIAALKRLLADEIQRVGRRNVVTGKQFSDMLAETLLRYQNRTLDTAQVIAELVELAKHLQAQQQRGADLGLTEDELAFYDAIGQNDAAVLELGDDTLQEIARELVAVVRRDAKTDWAVKAPRLGSCPSPPSVISGGARWR